MLQTTYFGNATFTVSSDKTSILIDPFITSNEECRFTIQEVVEMGVTGGVDAICITHLGYDHIGDAVTIAANYDTPVITEPGTKHYLREKGIDEEQITELTSGMKAVTGDLKVRALEAKHVSTRSVDGDLITGEPLSFIVSDGTSSVYHLGDTSIFRDLELFGELYQPDLALIGVGQAHSEQDDEGPVTRVLHELTTEEAVMAAQWINSKKVVPMHYLPEERESFIEMIEEQEDAPDVVPLDPGEKLDVN